MPRFSRSVLTISVLPSMALHYTLLGMSQDCVFCRKSRGKLPSHKVYEDDLFVAFMDITPRATGHVQVIPKKHHRWVWDVPEAGAYFEVARKIAKAQQQAFGVEKIYGNIAGDEVAHAHIWLYPAGSKGDK